MNFRRLLPEIRCTRALASLTSVCPTEYARLLGFALRNTPACLRFPKTVKHPLIAFNQAIASCASVNTWMRWSSDIRATPASCVSGNPKEVKLRCPVLHLKPKETISFPFHQRLEE
jgi:hypothetical protein